MSRKTKFSGLILYWKTYGQWAAILRSPYFHRAFFPWILLFPLWLFPFEGPFVWVGIALSVLPAMLSFSLAALAILLSMPTGEFFQVVTDDSDGPSFYLEVAASFTHFIIVQIWALLTVLLALAYPYPGTSALGFFSLCYAFACGIAAVSTLMSYGRLRNESSDLENPND